MISIIIPSYNGSQFIEKTINSVQKQVNVDMEIIVIDDCSVDTTCEIVEQLKEHDNRITLYKNSSNCGFCKTVNKAIDMCQGEYIMVLGQDDILVSNHIKEMIDLFDPGTALVFCDYVQIDDNDNVFDEASHCLHRDVILKDFSRGNAIPSCGLIMNKEILIMAGGYPEIEGYENYGEYNTWVRMAKLGRLKYCNSVKAMYRRHLSNITNSFTDERTKIKLERYYNICRLSFFNSNKLTIIDKMVLLLYIVLGYSKTCLYKICLVFQSVKTR